MKDLFTNFRKRKPIQEKDVKNKRQLYEGGKRGCSPNYFPLTFTIGAFHFAADFVKRATVEGFGVESDGGVVTRLRTGNGHPIAQLHPRSRQNGPSVRAGRWNQDNDFISCHPI